MLIPRVKPQYKIPKVRPFDILQQWVKKVPLNERGVVGLFGAAAYKRGVLMIVEYS